jgi:uncharacterized NAD(P)/FAD-binding protein YdhS
MEQSQMRTFVIIGAGFSGSLVAIHLVRAPAPTPRRVVLIERTGRFGRGVAYSTTCASHVLNVPAGRMSAFEDDPDHFLRWLRARDASIHGGAFVPRMLYGEYLESLLDDAQAAALPSVALERCEDEAIAIDAHTGEPTVQLAQGGKVIADRVVLALGNFAPVNPAVASGEALASPTYLRDPWDVSRYERLDPHQPVLLIGTGLTAFDVVLELAARGWQAPIYAISRRGLLPQAHRSPARPVHPSPPRDLNSWPPTSRGMLRALRAEVARQAKLGIDWREVLTSLRHATPRLWSSMTLAERARFLDRLRAHWDTHRHRAAPQAWSAIEGMIRTGRLQISAGRITGLTLDGNGLTAAIMLRGHSTPQIHTYGAVINCTGPDTNFTNVQSPLVQSLLASGLIRNDPLGLGLDADVHGAVIDRTGQASSWLYAMGPLRRPQLWETTAVPELRIQAEDVAREVIQAQVLCS